MKLLDAARLAYRYRKSRDVWRNKAEAMLAEERELHRTAAAVLRRYVDVYGDLPASSEVA